MMLVVDLTGESDEATKTEYRPPRCCICLQTYGTNTRRHVRLAIMSCGALMCGTCLQKTPCCPIHRHDTCSNEDGYDVAHAKTADGVSLPITTCHLCARDVKDAGYAVQCGRDELQVTCEPCLGVYGLQGEFHIKMIQMY